MKILKFNALDKDLKLYEEVKQYIRDNCEPSYEGVESVGGKDDLYCVDHTLEILISKKNAATDDDLIAKLEKVIIQLNAVASELDYLCINKDKAW